MNYLDKGIANRFRKHTPLKTAQGNRQYGRENLNINVERFSNLRSNLT